MDVKVGQVWRDDTGNFEVLKKDSDRLQNIFYVVRYDDGDCVDKCIFDHCMLIKDVPLSDLEIVQKALLKVECSLDIDRRGGWWVGDGKMINNNYRYSGKSMQSLLTWAKHTIGVE